MGCFGRPVLVPVHNRRRNRDPPPKSLGLRFREVEWHYLGTGLDGRSRLICRRLGICRNFAGKIRVEYEVAATIFPAEPLGVSRCRKATDACLCSPPLLDYPIDM